jgi:hypothetical protein
LLTENNRGVNRKPDVLRVEWRSPAFFFAGGGAIDAKGNGQSEFSISPKEIIS